MAHYLFEIASDDGAAGSQGLPPVVPVVITAGNGIPWDTVAIVDSGADRTMIPAESLTTFGVAFGDLDLPRVAKAVTGDEFEVRRLLARASLYGHVFAESLDVAEPGRFPSPLPMVGREDFFAAFEVCFRWNHTYVLQITPR